MFGGRFRDHSLTTVLFLGYFLTVFASGSVHESESEWEDIEEAEDTDDGPLRWVALWVE